MIHICGGCRGVAANNTVAVGGAVDARVQQIPAHQLLGIRDGVGTRAELSVGKLARLHGTRRHNAATGCCRVGLAPPRLVETSGVIPRCRAAILRAAEVVIATVPPIAIPSAASAGAATAARTLFPLLFFVFIQVSTRIIGVFLGLILQH